MGTAVRSHGKGSAEEVAAAIMQFSASKSFIHYYDDATYDKLPGYSQKLLQPYQELWTNLGPPSSLKLNTAEGR